MNLFFEKSFFVNKIAVSCDVLLSPGLNVLTGRNGIGKTSFLNYVKNNRQELFENKSCSFMDQFPLKPLSELRGSDVISIMSEDFNSFNKELVASLLEKFNFKSILGTKVEDLSGGENQILKFILLMGQNADFIFIDEPLQYLDDGNIALMLSTLENQRERIILMIEHRKEQLLQCPNKINWLEMLKVSDTQLEIREVKTNTKAGVDV